MTGLTSLINIYKYYPENHLDILYHRFGIEIFNIPLIYFDHKVAAINSTFSTIYLKGKVPDGKEYGPLFKMNPSREKIEKLARLYQEWTK